MQRVLRTVRGITAEAASALLELVGIDPTARPEVLSPETFAKLFSQLWPGN